MSQSATTWPQAIERYRHYLRTLDRSPCTEHHYASDLQQFARWHVQVYGHDPGIVETLDVSAWRQHLQAELRQAPASVNRRLSALKSYCAWQAETGITATDNGAGIKYVKVANQSTAPAVPSHAETLRLLKAVIGRRRDYALISLFVQCGLRLSEAAGIRLQDVQIGERKGNIRVIGKGNKVREVALNQAARDALHSYLRERKPSDDDHLFLSQRGTPLATRTIQHMVGKALKRAGCEGYTVHTLRHLFATNLYDLHKDIRLVQDALGHSRVEVTQRYTHTPAGALQEAVEQMKSNI